MEVTQRFTESLATDPSLLWWYNASRGNKDRFTARQSNSSHCNGLSHLREEEIHKTTKPKNIERK